MRYAGGMPNDAELTLGQKAARRRKKMTVSGLIAFMCGVPPLINSIDNPRLATLHGPDLLRIFAVGWCFGIGLTLLIIPRILRRES